MALGPEATRGAKARSIIRRRLPVFIATVCALTAALLLAPRSYVGGATGGHAATGSASLFDNCQQLEDQIALLEAEKADLQEQLKGAIGNQKTQILAQIKKLVAEITELKSQLHACQCPKTPPATDNLLELTGSSTLTNVDDTGAETFSLTLNLKNLTASPVMITRAEMLFADAGGWAYSVGDQLAANGVFSVISPTLPGNANYPNLSTSGAWSTPVKCVIFVIKATSGAQTQELITQIPINRPGYANVAPLPAERRVFIGLQEPIEVITLANGKKWLTVIGQVINGTSEPAALKSWKLSLHDSQNTMIWIESKQNFFDADLELKSFDGSASLNRFLYGFELPDDFTQGKLTIESDFVIGALCQNVIRTADVDTAPTLRATLQSPVRGLWNWGNGPGGEDLHSHKANSQSRYAYDLVMLKEVNGKLKSSDGPPDKNESYFCWDQPIYCVEDGWVVAIEDTIEDNSGNQGVNPANPGKKNSYVVVGHGQFRNYTRYSVYAHVRKDSANLMVDQPVLAGEELARVGNAGQSSAPHLHFSYITIDSTGHPRALPMQFSNLFWDSFWLIPATGVPIGGANYFSQ
ncbi:MAG: peptidoglycan DD-metalloendopeptidase family protein [Acidobacteria bacterium]|nr:peptidoglycan DD-metalloendopeptidase family protein [Acidobacteriota bacterium]